MPIAQLALEGNLKGLQSKIKKGAPLDGSDGERYDGDAPGCIPGAPLELPLGEAARIGHIDCVRALLDAGAPIDAIDFRGETALIMASMQDRLESVKLLLERGANPAIEGFAGNALAQVQLGWRPHAIEVAKLLLAAGCPPPVEKWAENAKAATKRETKVVKAILEAARIANVPELVVKLEKQLGITAKPKQGAAKAVDPKRALKDLAAVFRGIDDPDRRDAIENACKVVLASPAAIADPKWPELVRKAIAASWTYGDISEQAYGKRKRAAAMANDEGGAADAYTDDHLYTFDWVLTLLATPAAIAHAAWADLVLEVCKAKHDAVAGYSVCDEEIAALLAHPAARKHPRYAELVKAAKRANPFARIG